jgi:thiol-disulfide isomerase/thioredoxin
MKVRAPRLQGRGWLNSGALALSDLRGRFVLLDFWTSACVNCVQVIEELRPLEERYADVLTVIGVHSPKFPYEATPSAVFNAVARYRVEHPVLDDPELLTWDAYAANAWPTLVLVDPRGYVVAQVTGEGHVAELAGLIDELSVVHRDELRTDVMGAGAGERRPGETAAPVPDLGPTGLAGPTRLTELAGPTGPTGLMESAGSMSFSRHDLTFAPGQTVFPGGRALPGVSPERDSLRFPGGLLTLSDGRILVSDTGNQRLVLAATDATANADTNAVIGSGERGLSDGPPETSRFADPLGLTQLPPDIAAQVGYDVVIADSGNDVIRGLRLSDRTVTTIATGISTPGDVAWFDNRIVVAVIGRHQLWSLDPVTGAVQVYAGTGKEGLVDGPVSTAWFAQPSGLSVGPAGLWIADAESSALRLLYLTDRGPQIRTAIGQGLFEFGRNDGDGWDARLQHPLGVEALPDGTVAIADTFNGSVRRYDPVTDQVTTLRSGLGEPSALTSVPNYLLIADSARHEVARIEIEPGHVRRPEPIRVSVSDVSGETVSLEVAFDPPAGEEVDLREGDQTWLEITPHPPTLLTAGAGGAAGLTRELSFDDRISGGRTDGWLLVEARAASCDIDQGPGAVCHLHRRRWEVPVRLIPGSPASLILVL